MSRRSRLTVEVLVRLPLPAGATSTNAKKFVEEAVIKLQQYLSDAVESKGYKHPMAALSINGVTTKIVKRETVYL